MESSAASHNNGSWCADTDGFPEHSPSGGSLYYKGPALQKIILFVLSPPINIYQRIYTLSLSPFYFIVVQVQLSAFPPPLLAPTSGFVHVSFRVVPENPSLFPPIIPSHLPSGYCQIVLNFSVSGYTLFA